LDLAALSSSLFLPLIQLQWTHRHRYPKQSTHSQIPAQMQNHDWSLFCTTLRIRSISRCQGLLGICSTSRRSTLVLRIHDARLAFFGHLAVIDSFQTITVVACHPNHSGVDCSRADMLRMQLKRNCSSSEFCSGVVIRIINFLFSRDVHMRTLSNLVRFVLLLGNASGFTSLFPNDGLFLCFTLIWNMIE
jgi:hypothetical protein